MKTVKGYRSAIAVTLQALGTWGPDWDAPVGALLANMAIERPFCAHRTPKWDLSVVLKFLMGFPFEPLGRAELKWLTIKTVFLVALATAQRRSELHALALKEVKFHSRSQGHGVSLGFVPGFLAKTQSPSASARRVEIPALTNIVDRDLPDRTLCPVRALRFYVDKTQDPSFRRGRERLFVSYLEGRDTEIRPATIARWIVLAVRAAYKNLESNRTLRREASVTAHEVRALATSWADYKGVALAEVLKAASWAGHSTFSQFYLRDCSELADGMHAIGPVVAAQHVV